MEGAGLAGTRAVSLVAFMVMMKRLSAYSSLDVVDSKSVPNDLINYVFPYVVSFMGLDLGVDGKFYGFMLFIILMFIITYRSGQILMNPFAGFRLAAVRVEYRDGRAQALRQGAFQRSSQGRRPS